MTGRGKIARLPVELREELNRRIRNGEPGTGLIEWLNGLPEMQAVLALEAERIKVLEGSLKLARERFEFAAAEACLAKLPEMREIGENSDLSDEEKIDQARLALFGEVVD